MLGKDFLHRTQKQAIQKIRKLDFTKVRNVFSSNDSIKKIKKRQATDWERIFSKHIFDKEHISRIYKEFL